tara:strand:- start:570 stop:3602 length:3033 start_codon:yes stop_codon:yes gene_type:complete
MADPLILAAYAAAKFLQKGRREDAAAAVQLKKEQEAEAKATAEARVTPYGRTKPGGPIQQLNILDKNFADYTVTHRRFGTGEIKEVAPDEQTFPLFQLPDGTRGIKSELEKSVVSRAGRFGTWDDLKATQIGTRDVKGNKYTDNFDPEYLRPEKPKNVFVFEGADKKGNQIFGRTVQEVREKGGVEGSIGQKSVTPDVATALGFSGSVLSTEKKAFITPAPKADLGNIIVGQTKEGRFVYGEDVAAVRDQGAIKFGQADDEGFTPDGKIQTGSISWFTPDNEETKKESKQFATVYKLDENGERIDDKQIDIPLWQYRENTSKYQPVVGYEKDETGARKTIDIGIQSASAAKGAMEVADALFDIKHKDKEGKKQHFVIGKEGGVTPQTQLSKFRNWIENLPRKPDGTPDWTTAGIDNDGITKMRNYAVNLVAQNTTVKDPTTNEMVPSVTLLADQIAYVRNNFPVLSTIPQLEDFVKVRAGLDDLNTVRELTQRNSISPNGNAQSVVVAKVPQNLPATAIDPNASPDALAVPVKIPVAIPFDPKYNQTVDFVMAQLAPNQTEREIEDAKRAFRTLVNFERNPDGSVKTGPQGQVVIAKDQPKLDFVDYLVKTKDTGSTPFFTSFQNMLKLGVERKVTNAAVEADIKMAFNTAFTGDFEGAMSVVTAFSPRFGPARTRLLFRQMTGKNDALFKKERDSRVQQAESAANAINVIDKMVGTYYTRDGQFIDINTSLGQFYVSADGAVHLFQQGMENILPGLVSIDQSQAVTAAQNTIFGNDRNGKPSFMSIVDNQLPAADMLALANERGYPTVEKFIEAERTARKQNMTQFQESVSGLGSNDETVKNLALRNYYRFMVAYTMASAIQGGTGGRTISDQDVQNILRALKMDSVFGQASTEVEILQAAKEMLVDIEKHSRAIGQGGMRAYAALKVQELSIGSVGSNIRIGDIAERLEQGGGSGQPTAGDAAVAAMTNAEKLEKINAAQGKFGDTYTTIEEATAALGATGVARILAQ